MTALNGHNQVIKDRRIAGVVFTGSVEGGYQIQNATATRLIDATLELGGKDPAYVARDADLKYAVDSLVDGAMYNAGQSCCAIERVYCHEDVYHEFVEMAAERVTSDYILGDPLYEHPRERDEREASKRNPDDITADSMVDKLYDPDLPSTTNMGPMAQKSSISFLEQQVNEAVDKGAMIVAGDGRGCTDSKGMGGFFGPTVLRDCNHSMSVMKEESFGPILPIQSVADDQEAIAMMNDSDYGLTAAVFTKDKMKMERLFGPQIETGTVFMNRCDYLDPFLPWTGVKETGKGVSLSPYGFNNFTKLKSFHFKYKI